MGRLRKKFNEKARQSNSTADISESHITKEKVTVQIDVQEEKYDSSNPLVLCSKKKCSSKPSKQPTVNEKKPLSKKQKKKLASIIARKKKKINRAELLEKLSKVQAKPEELDFLKSTASMQTHGFKKFNEENSSNRDLKSDSKNNLPPKKKRKVSARSFITDDNFSDFDEESNDSTNQKNIADQNHDIENNENQKQACELFEDQEDSRNKEEVEKKESETFNEKMAVDECVSSAKNINLKKDNFLSTEELKSDCNANKNSSSDAILCSSERVPAVFVTLDRKPEVQTAREALPIFCEEQSIMEAVRENPIVVIHGETGSGKTTQVPQFLYEGGYTANNKMIGITEPRRIAAMTMAARVGTEMNLPDVVAYHVRYENNMKEETKIKFMTDGVLLKEIRHDFFLSKYSVIIIDEAHERSVFSDVLIGLLSRIVPLRTKRGDPLKLIVMSATIRVEDFIENPKLFRDPPLLIRLESRQYKVQVHFNITTPSDYLEAAFHKVCKIHTQLPAGAILVFLTGEKEVTRLCKMLRNAFPFKDNLNYETKNLKVSSDVPNTEIRKKKKKKMCNDTSFCSLTPKIDLDNYAVEPLDTEFQDDLSDNEDTSVLPVCTAKQDDVMPLYTLPLYSILPFSEQEKVFQPPPAGTRLCVVSTNVAETSITIPGLKYVVDSGKVKTKVFDKCAGGISKFCITWTSKASSNQRAGRAGRTEGGHCYRLYSSSVFEHEFLDFSPPEIQRIPADDVLLQMKALGIDRVVNFPFPSPPDSETLKAAEQRLVLLGALQDLNKGERYKEIKKWEYSAKITPLGKAMSRFPLSPRYSKMLILSYKHMCVPYIIAIVSAMTVPEVFLNMNSTEDSSETSEKKTKKINAGTGKSLQLGDAMVLLRAVALYKEAKNKVQFCFKNGIRHKAMVEINKMGVQLSREMTKAFQDLSLDLDMQPPSEEDIEKLRKILTTGFTDHVARLFPEEEMKLNKELKNAYKCLDLEDPVFIHPSSVLFSELPRYIIYQEIVHTSKYYMKGVIEINPEWLPAFAPTLCKFSEPLEEPAPTYDREKDQILCTMNVNFGAWQWDLPPVIMEMPKGLLKYSWFAFFLLDGQIHIFFKHYRRHLLSSPSTILKSWARLLPRTRYLLQALIEKEVDSRDSLEKIWKEEPKYLLREYWEWLSSDKHMEIECNWPPK